MWLIITIIKDHDKCSLKLIKAYLQYKQAHDHHLPWLVLYFLLSPFFLLSFLTFFFSLFFSPTFRAPLEAGAPGIPPILTKHGYSPLCNNVFVLERMLSLIWSLFLQRLDAKVITLNMYETKARRVLCEVSYQRVSVSSTLLCKHGNWWKGELIHTWLRVFTIVFIGIFGIYLSLYWDVTNRMKDKLPSWLVYYYTRMCVLVVIMCHIAIILRIQIKI